MGDVDVVRTLGLAGIRSVAVVEPGNPARYSRFTVAALDKIDPATDPEAAVEQLLDFAAGQTKRPILFYDGDWDLLLVSRYRSRLSEGFDFIIPNGELVEDLVDKARYQDLADRLDIPVPRALGLSGGDPFPAELGFAYPVVVKPLTRHHGTWRQFALTKARHIADQDELRTLHAQLGGTELIVLVQEVVPGPEDRVLSYHCYVDEAGEIVGEFTDRKLRTYPKVYGYSTAIEITDSPEVRERGIELTRRLGLRSAVAKFDFKRAPDDSLVLLEVNPRFNLVHHPGALAGVNLPQLVYCDLAGLPRPAAPVLRTGVTWCNPAHDYQAAAAWDIGKLRWLKMVATSDAYSGFAWNDPFPLAGAVAWRARQRLRSLQPRHSR